MVTHAQLLVVKERTMHFSLDVKSVEMNGLNLVQVTIKSELDKESKSGLLRTRRRPHKESHILTFTSQKAALAFLENLISLKKSRL